SRSSRAGSEAGGGTGRSRSSVCIR
ncbi:MAG: hypothetical protein AVDCRST_MAG93-7102, partial [uncultured Chloroflexia bacterium]